MSQTKYDNDEDSWNEDDEYDEYDRLYGTITKVEILGYWKYQFTLQVTTDKGHVLTIITGGDKDDIYKYNPHSLLWKDHPEIKIVKG